MKLPDISFSGCTTITTVDTSDKWKTTTNVRHIVRFYVVPGIVPDMQRKFGKWIFRPDYLMATYRNGNLAEVTVSGPRVTKNGLSRRDTGYFEWGRPWFADDEYPFDYSVLPGPIVEALRDYESAQATFVPSAL